MSSTTVCLCRCSQPVPTRSPWLIRVKELMPVTSRKPEPGEIVLLQVGPNARRQESVQRDDDILTPAQLKEHWPEVKKAMLKELQTWATLKCFSRKAWSSARNITCVRWVIKFK